MDATNSPNNSLDTEIWTMPADLKACVAGLVNAAAGGMEETAPHGLTHIDFALLRLRLWEEEWTTTQLARRCR